MQSGCPSAAEIDQVLSQIWPFLLYGAQSTSNSNAQSCTTLGGAITTLPSRANDLFLVCVHTHDPCSQPYLFHKLALTQPHSLHAPGKPPLPSEHRHRPRHQAQHAEFLTPCSSACFFLLWQLSTIAGECPPSTAAREQM